MATSQAVSAMERRRDLAPVPFALPVTCVCMWELLRDKAWRDRIAACRSGGVIVCNELSRLVSADRHDGRLCRLRGRFQTLVSIQQKWPRTHRGHARRVCERGRETSAATRVQA